MADKDDPKKGVNLDNIPMGVVGRWNEIDFNQKDLKEIVDTFNILKEKHPSYRPKLSLGHPENQKLIQDGGFPNAGTIDTLKLVGKKIYANIINVPEKIAEFVKSGNYDATSPEFFRNIDINGTVYNRVLARLALLGDELPAMLDLPTLQESFSNDTYEEKFSIEIYTPKYISKLIDNLFDNGELNAANSNEIFEYIAYSDETEIQKALEGSKSYHLADNKKELNELFKGEEMKTIKVTDKDGKEETLTEEQFNLKVEKEVALKIDSAVEEKFKTYQDKIDTLSTEVVSLNTKNKLDKEEQFTTKLNVLVEESKITPAVVELVKPLISTFSHDTKTKFKMGDTEVEMNQFALLGEILNALKPATDYQKTTIEDFNLEDKETFTVENIDKVIDVKVTEMQKEFPTEDYKTLLNRVFVKEPEVREIYNLK